LAQGLFSSQPTLETDPEKLERIIFYFALKECTKAALLGKKEVAIAMRVMYRWGLEENLPGFNEHSDLELAQIKVNSPDNRYLVTMRDTTLGPLTRAQLSLAENQLISKETVTTDQRALFLLGRDWGLRPIQMALMRTSDFGNDQGGPFIMVPSVKGIRRSKLRRHPSNLLKRYIADDTAEALQAQCRAAESLVKEAIPRIRTLCQAHGIKEHTLPTPLFPSPNRTPARLLRYLQSPKLVQYTLHVDSHRISHTIKSLTWTLGVRNPHSSSIDENGYMQITAYRLRRTKGTSMVLSGATPEEVAEALDHQNISSIAHYFRYNLELQDFINRVHIASPEIRAAVEMWDGRFLEEVDDDSTYRPISNLGKCSRPTMPIPPNRHLLRMF
jgi:integrase